MESGIQERRWGWWGGEGGYKCRVVSMWMTLKARSQDEPITGMTLHREVKWSVFHPGALEVRI